MPPSLFEPIGIGSFTTSHRVVLAPLTRHRATKAYLPVLPLVKTYYSQRASFPGTLLITEATFIHPKAGGYENIAGIWNRDQIHAWKEITKGVHANGSFIFLQLWALGRAANAETLNSQSDPLVSSSPTPLSRSPSDIPHALSIEEIDEYVQLYATAACNAMEANFDGVEIHCANGYLIDQFLQDTCNVRQDEYGGTVANRSRFGLRVVEAVANAIGADRTGVRISPWSTFNDMGMVDPIPQFTHFVSSIKTLVPTLAYLHVIETGAHGSDIIDAPKESINANDFVRRIWEPKPLISAGRYTRETALDRTEKHQNELIAFGKLFISNPDLPYRLLRNINLTDFDRQTFFTLGDEEGLERGYIDYPFVGS